MDGTFIGCFCFGFDYLLVASCQCPSLAKHPWSQNLQDASKPIFLVKIPNTFGHLTKNLVKCTYCNFFARENA
jgi:hypothetical protein